MPEDRRRPAGRSLSLKIVVIPSRSATPAREPIFYFQGGPGQAAAEAAPGFVNSWERTNHDLVLIDQRGTGPGHRLECPGPGTDDHLEAYLDSPYRAPYPRLCRELLEQRADLSQYTTPIAMRDVDEIRRALGYSKINVWGGSYGSRAALTYIRMFGKHVRAGLLAGLTPPEIKLPLFHAGNAQRALDRLFSDCRSDRACNAAYPDLKAQLEALRETLRRKPATISIPNPFNDKPANILLTEDRFLATLRPLLYSTETARRIPLAIHRGRAGDFTELVSMVVPWIRGAYQSMAAGMSLSVLCSEDVARITPEEIARETANTFMGPELVEERVRACAEWPAGALPADQFRPFRADVPVLLLSGEYDPVTPPRWGEATRAYFPNSAHIVLPVGHGFPDDACIAAIGREFFRRGTWRGLDTSCTASIPVPPFAMPPSP